MLGIKEKLESELHDWMSRLHVGSDTRVEDILEMYAYEYLVKLKLISYFSDHTVNKTVTIYLLNMPNLLGYLYQQYQHSDDANIYSEVERFADTLCKSLAVKY